jgi:hypothetical protein
MLFGPSPEDQAPEVPQAPQTCLNCGATLQPDYVYCTNCGTRPSAGGFCTRCGTKLDPSFRFCTNCGLDVSGITGAAYVPAPGSYPVQFDVQYPEKLSRLLIFVKWLLAIPQYLVVYALGSVISVVTFICFFAILFTGRYPRGLFNMVVGFTRWGANVSAYTSLMRDEYPPFSMDPGQYPATFEVEYPERLSRWKIFVKWLLIIPNQIVLGLLAFVGFFVTFLAWWAILFTGRYPRGFFNFNVGVIRWTLRAGAYTNLLRDEYPPYSMRPEAKASGWKAIAIGIVAGIFAIATMIAALVAISTIDPQTEVVIVDYQRLETGAGFQPPPVSVDGTRVALNDVEDPYEGFFSPESDTRFVAFTMNITNEDALFTTVDYTAFDLEDSLGDSYEPVEIITDPSLGFDNQLGQDESVVAEVIFDVPAGADPESLTYSPGFAQFLPIGERVRFEFR